MNIATLQRAVATLEAHGADCLRAAAELKNVIGQSEPEPEWKPLPFDVLVRRLWASPPQPRKARKRKT